MENRENLRIRKQTMEVKGVLIEFEEYYKVDPITEEEVFDRELEIENDSRLYDIYKKHQKEIWNDTKRICTINWCR